MKPLLSLQQFDEWCAEVPGLHRQGELYWANFDEASISYPDSGLIALEAIEPRSYWFRHRNDLIVSLIKQHPPEGVLMDIGGGNGFVSSGISDAGYATVVVEAARSGVLTARRRGLPVIEAAFQNLNLPPNTIGAAGLFDVLEHIPDDFEALTRIRNILIPGGMIYISVPALSGLWSSEDVKAGHYRRYSRKLLCEKLINAGFLPIRATYFFAALVPPIFALRSLAGYMRLRKGGNAEKNGVEHELPAGTVGKLLQRSFEIERTRIEKGLDVPIGSSLLIVAQSPGI